MYSRHVFKRLINYFPDRITMAYQLKAFLSLYSSLSIVPAITYIRKAFDRAYGK